MADVTSLDHATVITCNDGEVLEDVSVVIEGNRIVGIGSGVVSGTGRRVDCSGLTITPGLIDAHVHMCSIDVDVEGQHRRYPSSLVAGYVVKNLREALLQGFTTLRDAGGTDWGFKRAVDEGLVAGPRLFVSGRAISQTGGHGDRRTRAEVERVCDCGHAIGMVHAIADGVDEVRKAVREEIRKGASQIKVMASGGVASPTDRLESNQFSPEEVEVAVAEAQAAGTYVMAHAYTPEAIGKCVRAGVRSIEHGNLLSRENAKEMAEKGTFLVTNFIAYEMLFREGEKEGMSGDKREKLDLVYSRGLEALEIARDAGVRLGSGSDLLGPLASHRAEELGIKSQVLGSVATLEATTMGNAELLGIAEEIGSVTEGKIADLLVVEGDVLADAGVLGKARNLRGIIQAGQFVKDELV